MTLNGVMAVILPYFSEFGYLPGVLRKRSRSLSHLLMSSCYCGQTAGWMKTPLGTEVNLGAGHIVLDGLPGLRERGTTPPPFRPMSIVATVAHLSYC